MSVNIFLCIKKFNFILDLKSGIRYIVGTLAPEW
jgi:hypothetical protein